MPASFGKYYDLIDQGNTFILSTAAAGVALPIVTGTAGTFALWNTTSDKKAVLHRITIGYTSGTLGVGEFVLGSFAAGTAIGAAGAPVTAFQDATPGQTVKNAKAGASNQPSMRVAPAGTTTFAASTAFPWFYLGVSSVGTAAGFYRADVELDGLIVMPGQLVFLGGSVAQAGVVSASLMFSEVPI
jgi:hypothetical protein